MGIPKTLIAVLASMLLLTQAAHAQDIIGPGPDNYSSPGGGSDGSKLYLSLSFGEGVYFQYNCSSSYNCETYTVSPADFELLLGYRLARHWQLDLGMVWAMDFDTYGNRLTSMVGVRPGIRLLLPGLYKRLWYLRAAVPVLAGVTGENDDILFGFMLGVGLEIRFHVVGFFAEINFSPYFVQVADQVHVIPAQGRLGVSFRF
jgi:hypothetical protein